VTILTISVAVLLMTACSGDGDLSGSEDKTVMLKSGEVKTEKAQQQSILALIDDMGYGTICGLGLNQAHRELDAPPADAKNSREDRQRIIELNTEVCEKHAEKAPK
jgi:hypothetical protein